jgi:hypothetical protein
MPWSGAAGAQVFSRNTGAFSGATCWAQSDAASRGIRSDDHDTHDQDVADGINATLHKGGGNTASANIPMGGFKLTGLAAGSAAGDSLRFEQLESGVLTTRGDLLYRGASAPVRLPKGANGQFLKQGANDPSWATLGTAALVDTGTSGAKVAMTNGGNTWSAGQGIEFTVGSGWMFHTKANGKVALGNTWISTYFFDGNTAIAGSITHTSGGFVGGSTSYNTSSDGRYKFDQRPLDDWEEIVVHLQPKYWRWGGKGDEVFGLVAQDMQAVPQIGRAGIITVGDDGALRDAKDGFKPWMYQKGSLEGVLVAAVKGLLGRVRELEAGGA